MRTCHTRHSDTRSDTRSGRQAGRQAGTPRTRHSGIILFVHTLIVKNLRPAHMAITWRSGSQVRVRKPGKGSRGCRTICNLTVICDLSVSKYSTWSLENTSTKDGFSEGSLYLMTGAEEKSEPRRGICFLSYLRRFIACNQLQCTQGTAANWSLLWLTNVNFSL